MKSIDSIILRPESSYIEIVFLGIENYGQGYAKIDSGGNCILDFPERYEPVSCWRLDK